jgi:hypothetical protein
MVIELGGSVFEITHDLVGDLFRAKNAGVTAWLTKCGLIVRAMETSIFFVQIM